MSVLAPKSTIKTTATTVTTDGTVDTKTDATVEEVEEEEPANDSATLKDFVNSAKSITDNVMKSWDDTFVMSDMLGLF